MTDTESLPTIDQITWALRAGESPKQIAFRFNCSVRHIYETCAARGLSPKQFRQPGATHAINFRVTRETLQRLDFLCTRANRTRTEALVSMIEKSYAEAGMIDSAKFRDDESLARVQGANLGSAPLLAAWAERQIEREANADESLVNGTTRFDPITSEEVDALDQFLNGGHSSECKRARVRVQKLLAKLLHQTDGNKESQ